MKGLETILLSMISPLDHKFLFLFPSIQNMVEFNKIDSYHGTGAFNITQFPTWDSLFLNLVTHPVDTVVVTVKQKNHRRRGFGPQGNYMSKLGSSSSTTTPPRTRKAKSGLPERKKPSPPPPQMGMGSFLDGLTKKEETIDSSSSSKIKSENRKSQEKQRNDEKKKKKKKPQRKQQQAKEEGGTSLGGNYQPKANPYMEEVGLSQLCV